MIAINDVGTGFVFFSVSSVSPWPKGFLFCVLDIFLWIPVLQMQAHVIRILHDRELLA